jgi:glycosyltransferase involved in cell wall biosynthesis
MLAPHVFFQPRGTPLSVSYRAKALGEAGHQVDVLTYHLGQPFPSRNVRVIRAWRVPFINSLKPGPSTPKIFLDASLLLKMLWLIATRPYDLIYTHEEAALFGAMSRLLFRKRHAYDMHSSMPLQLEDWEYSTSKLLRKVFDIMERFIIRHSDVVVPICRNLEEIARKIKPDANIVTVENTAVLADEPKANARRTAALAKKYGLRNRNVILYTGTFLKIQGLDLLLHAAPVVIKKVPCALFLFVGGTPEEIAAMQKKVDALGIGRNVLLLPQHPQTDMPSFYALADVLTSPREIGINAPLKIFSYLNSGKPVIVTDLPIHTQIVQAPAAVLVKPDAKLWAGALIKLLTDAQLRKRTGAAGKKLVAERYSYKRYRERLDEAVRLAVQ